MRHTDTHRHVHAYDTHTHYDSTRRNAMPCISPKNSCAKGGDNECSQFLRNIGWIPSGPPADFGSNLRIRVITFANVFLGLFT